MLFVILKHGGMTPHWHVIILLRATYNHSHNILRLSDALPNFRVPTSETMRVYYLWTWFIRVASRLASWNDSLVLIPPAKIKVLLKLAKKSWKTEIIFSRRKLFHMKTRVSLKHPVNDCSHKSIHQARNHGTAEGVSIYANETLKS